MRKTILVTGGSGFIGSNLIRILRHNDRYRVINLDKLTYAATPASLADLEDDKEYIFIQGDIGNRELVRHILREYQPVGFFNLAAESHVDRSIVDAAAFLQTNIVGTYHLLDESLHYWRSLSEKGRRDFRFLHVSTDEVFGELGDDGYFDENTSYAPNSPYSASKASSDHFVRAYHHTYGMPVLITNCSNNYGPYQFPEKLVPMMIFNALQGKPLPVYGDGSNIRDWIYVEDHCNALVQVFENGRTGETYVIGGNAERKNIDLVKEICHTLDEISPIANNSSLDGLDIESYVELIQFVADRPGHDYRYAIDTSKMKSELAWSQEEDLDTGLRKTVRWYVDNLEWVDQASGGSFGEWLTKNYAWRVMEDK